MMHHHLPADSALQPNLAHIEHAANHALELTDTLRIYTRQTHDHLQAVDLKTHLSGIIAHFAATRPEWVTLRTNINHGSITVFVCPAMFEHAITGILQNAIDAFAGQKGEISIETGTDDSQVDQRDGLFLGTMPGGNIAILEIRDSGEGISAEVLEHMLEPFFSTRIRASGLGLAPAAGLVFHCNAAIHVLSTPGKGTCFRLLLPTHA